MNAAAKAVMTEMPDVIIAYGVSDEYRYFCFCPFLGFLLLFPWVFEGKPL
jgi:hypothetical protein